MLAVDLDDAGQRVPRVVTDLGHEADQVGPSEGLDFAAQLDGERDEVVVSLGSVAEAAQPVDALKRSGGVH